MIFDAQNLSYWEEIGFLIGGFLVFYIWIVAALHALAKREGVNERWRAWVPLAQWFLLIEIGQKPKRWAYFIFLPTVLVLTPAVIDVGIFPDFLRIIIGAVAGLAVAALLILLALTIAAIAKRQGRALPNLLGVLAAFAFPAGLAILSMLAWGKVAHHAVTTKNYSS